MDGILPGMDAGANDYASTSSLSTCLTISEPDVLSEEEALLADYDNKFVDFFDEEVKEFYSSLPEEAKLALWKNVLWISDRLRTSLTVHIPKLDRCRFVSGWWWLLDLPGEETGLDPAVWPNGHPSGNVIPPLTSVETSTSGSTSTLTNAHHGSSLASTRAPPRPATIPDAFAGANNLKDIVTILRDPANCLDADQLQAVLEKYGSEAATAQIFKAQTAAARRRHTAPAKKQMPAPSSSEAEDEVEEPSGKNPHNLPAAERKKLFPRKDLNLDTDFPPDERLSLLQILEIPLRITEGEGRSRGKWRKNRGYLIHCEAPYAYTYEGKLRNAYFGAAKMVYEEGPKKGERIWSAEMIKKFCKKYDENRVKHPEVFNAKGALYSRLPPHIHPARDENQRFKVRASGEPARLTALGREKAIVAAFKGEDDLCNIKEFEGKDIGVRRIKAPEERKMKAVVQGEVLQARFFNLSKDVKDILQALVDKALSEHRLDTTQRVEALAAEVEELKERICTERNRRGRLEWELFDAEQETERITALKLGVQQEVQVCQDDIGALKADVMARDMELVALKRGMAEAQDELKRVTANWHNAESKLGQAKRRLTDVGGMTGNIKKHKFESLDQDWEI